MKILVSGAHGFIGSHVVQRLLETGNEVVAVVSPWGNTRNLETVLTHSALTVVRADVTKPTSLRNLPRHECVVHAAARVADWGPSKPVERTNVDGTRNLLHRAEELGAARFVLISSVAVHRYTGFQNADPRTVPRDRYTLPYAWSKILAEDIVLGAPTLEGVVVRPGLWPFGPRDPQFTRVLSALRRRQLPLVDGGKAVINTAYIGNLVEGIELAIFHPEAVGKTYVIADEGSPCWAQVFKEIALQTGSPAPQYSVPGWLARTAGIVGEKMFAIITPSTEPPLTSYRGQLMTRDVHFDIAFARKELGYHPKIPWQEGIRRTVEAIQ